MARPIFNLVIDILTIIIVAVIVLLVVHLVRADAECLNSAQAVWDAHPRSHATWNLVDGRECWRVGYGKRSSTSAQKEVVRNEQRGQRHTPRLSSDETKPRPLTPAGTIPLPRPRQEAMITPHLSYEHEAAMWRALLFGETFGAVGSR